MGFWLGFSAFDSARVPGADCDRQHSAVCDQVITVSHSNDYYCSAYPERGTNSDNTSNSLEFPNCTLVFIALYLIPTAHPLWKLFSSFDTHMDEQQSKNLRTINPGSEDFSGSSTAPCYLQSPHHRILVRTNFAWFYSKRFLVTFPIASRKLFQTFAFLLIKKMLVTSSFFLY